MGWVTGLIQGVFGVIAKPIEEWQKRKTLEIAQEDKQLERQHDINLKKLDIAFELAKGGQKIEANWDASAQRQMKYTWKDEYLLILFSSPLVMAFIPSMQPYVAKGFAILETTPEWYMVSVLGIVAATFGLRWALKRFIG